MSRVLSPSVSTISPSLLISSFDPTSISSSIANQPPPAAATADLSQAAVPTHIEFTGWRRERRYRPGRVERESTTTSSANKILFDPGISDVRATFGTNDVNPHAEDETSCMCLSNLPAPEENSSLISDQIENQLTDSKVLPTANSSVKLEKNATMANGTARKQALEFLKFQATMSDAWVCSANDDVRTAAHATDGADTVPTKSSPIAESSTFPSSEISSSHATTISSDETEHSASTIACSSSSSGGSQYKRKLGLQRLVLQGATTAKIPGLGSVIQTSGHQFIPNPGKSLSYAKTGGAGSASDSSADSRVSLEKQREEKFELLLNTSTGDINLEQLQQLSWSGIPHRFRARVWKLLVGYMPLTNDPDRRMRTLAQKRKKYTELCDEHFPKRLHAPHNNTFRQIHIDIPRMSLPLFQQERVQHIFERILFIWAVQNPQCGYVQGINDLLQPYFFVYLQDLTADYERLSPSKNFQLQNAVRDEQLQQLEADCYWSLVHLLSSIGDYYTFAQPGIQRNVEFLKDLLQRVDNDLYEHLFRCQVEFLHFSFRWMNNLLIRELPFSCVVRLWDTLLAEPEGFSTFIVYVCASFMCMWSKELQEQPDFQSTLLLLQNLPTSSWGENEVRLLVADAFRLRYTYENALSHLKCNN